MILCYLIIGAECVIEARGFDLSFFIKLVDLSNYLTDLIVWECSSLSVLNLFFFGLTRGSFIYLIDLVSVKKEYPFGNWVFK
jgi:hypothetical protein